MSTWRERGEGKGKRRGKVERAREPGGKRGQEREEGSSSPFYSVRSLGRSLPGYCQVIEGWGFQNPNIPLFWLIKKKKLEVVVDQE